MRSGPWAASALKVEPGMHRLSSDTQPAVPSIGDLAVVKGFSGSIWARTILYTSQDRPEPFAVGLLQI